MEENNLINWNKLKTPPSWAIKPITGGRLKGKTDINPQWRYKVMTEVYGPIGIGWKFTIDNVIMEAGSDGQRMVFVTVSVSVKTGNDWCYPVTAIGGDFVVEKESNGLHSNDEAIKMATTDALGTALKYFGVASDIYEGGNRDTKYNRNSEPSKPYTPPLPKPATDPQKLVAVQLSKQIAKMEPPKGKKDLVINGVNRILNGVIIDSYQIKNNLIKHIEAKQIFDLLKRNGIPNDSFFIWLKVVYGLEYYVDISQDALPGIMDVVSNRWQEITKVAADYQNAPGKDDIVG
jgi:hypothetical protein